MDSIADKVRRRFRRFAEVECKGYGNLYYHLALSVAADDELVDFIAAMPDTRPNLFLASVHYLAGTRGMPANGTELSSFVEARRAEVARLMQTHGTQTNEVGRCATIVPALPDGPLALVEVGASAGLCLMLDRYFYDYGEVTLGNADSTVRLCCRLTGPVAPSPVIPEVVWRCGLDTKPLNLNDPDGVKWLMACIWPDHADRRERLRLAVELSKSDPPEVRKGDLVDDLLPVLEDAPEDGTLVVFHSAVFPYVSLERRLEFAQLLLEYSKKRKVVWISNESPGVLPEIAALLPGRSDARKFCTGRTVLSRGRRTSTLLGLAHPHGAELEWFGV